MHELKKYQSWARIVSGYGKEKAIDVVEYFVEENVFEVDGDGDGEFWESGGIWGFAESDFKEIREPEI